jgi:hypothetical protein
MVIFMFVILNPDASLEAGLNESPKGLKTATSVLVLTRDMTKIKLSQYKSNISVTHARPWLFVE